MNSYMIKQAVLPTLEDDSVSDVSVDEGGEAIFVGRGGDLDGVQMTRAVFNSCNGLYALKWNGQLYRMCVRVFMCVSEYECVCSMVAYQLPLVHSQPFGQFICSWIKVYVCVCVYF